MPSEPRQLISAQVLLRPASGRRIRGAAITSKNVAEFAPPADVAEQVANAFRQEGFEVGPLVGVSFSITAPASEFERVFEVRLSLVREGSVKVAGKREDPDTLPVASLPPTIAERIEAVTFTPPPDFGPTSFSEP
jgi:hypothetical protein